MAPAVVFALYAGFSRNGRFAWYYRGYGSWENGPFLVYNWVIFGGILIGSALLYGLLLLVFREEQVLRLKNHMLQINTK